MSDTNNLFDEAAGRLTINVKKIGNAKVKPAPSLAEANHCRPYHLVVKRKSWWIWKKSQYFPLAHTISDILVKDGVKFEEKETLQKECTEYNTSTKLDLEGTLGVSLAKDLAAFDLDANHHVDLTLDIGKVAEHYLDVPELAKDLEERKLNMKHKLILETRNHGRQILCLIVASYNNTEESKITTEVKGGGSASANVNVPEVPVEVDGSFKGSSEKKLCQVIPANTPLAYRPNEMLVNEDGSMQLMQIPGSKGGFTTIMRMMRTYPSHEPPTDGLEEIRQTVSGNIAIDLLILLDRHDRSGPPDEVLAEIRSYLKPILDLQAAEKEVKDTRAFLEMFFRASIYKVAGQLEPIFEKHSDVPQLEELRNILQMFMEMQSGLRPAWEEYSSNEPIDVEKPELAHQDDLVEVGRCLVGLLTRPMLLGSLIRLIKDASIALLVGEVGKLTTKEALQELLGCSELDDTLKSLLQAAGFTFNENDVTYPTSENYESLDFLDNVLDLLTPLNEEQRIILSTISHDERQTIVDLVSGAVKPTGLPFDGPTTENLFRRSLRVESLLDGLGFKAEQIRGKWTFVHRGVIGDDELNPLGLLAIMRYLWGFNIEGVCIEST